jgi:hypothetical protein
LSASIFDAQCGKKPEGVVFPFRQIFMFGLFGLFYVLRQFAAFDQSLQHLHIPT